MYLLCVVRGNRERGKIGIYTTILLKSRNFIVFLSSCTLKELKKNGGSSRNVHS